MIAAMAAPDPTFVTVPHDEDTVRALLSDLFVTPRSLIEKWSRITSQTTQVRIAYPGQHLASVVTGVSGRGTAARGEDLRDGSEVKSCSRADQLGACRDCAEPVLPWQEECPQCGGTRIDRRTDSHWILSIKSEDELRQYIAGPRIVLVLFDRTAEEQRDIRARVWEIWPEEERHAYFAEFVTYYWQNNFVRKRDAGLRAAPCNLHPLMFDFYLMNPVLTFDATIHAPDSPGEAEVRIRTLVDATTDRATLEPDLMPVQVARKDELVALFAQLTDDEVAPLLLDGTTVADVRAAVSMKNPVRALSDEIAGIPALARRRLVMRAKRVKMTPSTYRRARARGA
jgi:hypothetical protein